MLIFTRRHFTFPCSRNYPNNSVGKPLCFRLKTAIVESRTAILVSVKRMFYLF